MDARCVSQTIRSIRGFIHDDLRPLFVAVGADFLNLFHVPCQLLASWISALGRAHQPSTAGIEASVGNQHLYC